LPGRCASGDLGQLLLRGGQLPHGRLRSDGQVHHRHVAQGLAPHGLPVDGQAAAEAVQLVQHDVLGHRGPRHHLDFLVHDADAVGQGVEGALQVQRLSFQEQLPLVGRVDAADDAHQRALARPVLPQQGVDGAGREGHAHLVESLHSREALADRPHL
jgi:hypothetical protein